MNTQKKEVLQINDVKITASELPFRCPVCSGFGTVKYGTRTCHACDGKGYIVVKQEGEK